MKLFGQFLIDEGLITKEDFVAAMIIQAQNLPSLAMAVHELKFFSIDQQMEIFNYQSTHFREYRAACVEMGIWDEANAEQVLGRYFLKHLKPVGEILVDQGRLTLEQLSEVLERYVALGEGVNARPERAPAARLSLVKTGAQRAKGIHDYEGALTAAAEKRLFRLYCEAFDEAFLTRLKACFTAQGGACQVTLQKLRAVEHAAGFIRASKSVKLCQTLLALGDGHKPKGAELSLIEQAIQMLWTLRQGLDKDIPEIVSLAAGGLDSRADELCFIIGKIGQSA